MLNQHSKYAVMIAASIIAASGIVGCGATPDPVEGENDQSEFELKPSPNPSTSASCSLKVGGATGLESDGLIPVCCTPEGGNASAAQSMFRRINEYRQANGLNELTYDPNLEAAMQGHTVHMYAHGFFGHYAPEVVVSAPWDRAALCDSSGGAEILAKGFSRAGDVVQAWKDSPGHNAIMLTPELTRAGAGQLGAIWGVLFGY